jgi:ubiquinone/menaquinone biosynthesis C-methylase UbiE
MHPAVFNVFEEICRARAIRGAVLEIGATLDESTLLNLPSLAGAGEKIGINKTGGSRFKDFAILEADANDMTCFPDRRFDVVLCNAVLEHDPFFWKTLAEIRRVVRVGGLVAIGTPGYRQLPFETKLRRWLARLSRFSRHPDGWPLQHSTLTLGVHNFPSDYYRFSEQTFREVFFEGMTEVVIRTVLVPPRIIGAGVRT